MDEHIWTMPARNSAEPAVDWRADRTGLWMGGELIGFPEASREILRLAEGIESAAGLLRNAERIIDRGVRENALLRRERVLLIELEKARTRILASIFDTGGGCSADDVRQVGELLMSIEAIHLESSGGVPRPEGVPCACVLCRPEGAEVVMMRTIVTGQAPTLDTRPPFRCEGCGERLAAGAVIEMEAGLCHTREARDEKGVPYPDYCGPVRAVRAHTGAPGNSRAIRDDDDHSSR